MQLVNSGTYPSLWSPVALATLALLLVLSVDASAQQNCQLVWAQNVLSHFDGNGQQSNHADPNDALGDTGNTYFSMGLYGKIELDFGADFTTSGDSNPDFCVRDKDDDDCVFVCLFPADAATAQALLAAGMSENNGFYEFNTTFCGNFDLDLDALVPGHNEGELRFSKVLLIDDCATSNGTELEQVCALVCTPTSTPPTPSNCELVWAQSIVSHAHGSNQESNNDDEDDVLGDTPNTYYSLGRNGSVAVAFGADFTTSGDSAPDVCVREDNDNDCYYICLFPADAATASALAAAGMSENNGYYEFSVTYCGDVDLDLDNLIPGYNEGELQFANVLILDDGSSGNGAEIEQICALVCSEAPDCVVTWADSIIDFMVGSNPIASAPDENSVLGDTPTTMFSLGNGGYITLGFGANFSTSGSNAFDISIDEHNVPDCYTLRLKPASGSTFLALQDVGLTLIDGSFELPTVYCGDNEIDLDAIVPGFNSGELQFESLTIVDDASGGDGSEFYRVSTLVCDPANSTLAELGDCVFIDEDCDGILDAGEPGKQHVTVVLIRPSDGAVVDFMMTGADGKYRFTNIIPGDYLVVFNFNQISYAATLANVGTDDEVDSDFDPTTGFVPVTLGPGEINNSIDFGVCEICVGPPATQFSRPCGFDPVNDPVLESTLLIPGDPITLTLTSNFPGQLSWIYYSLGNVAPITYMGCTFSLDVLNTATNLGIAIIAPADENGVLTYTTPDPIPAGFDGFTVIFQGRVCAADNGPPGPFAPLPDFFSNGLIMTIGCP